MSLNELDVSALRSDTPWYQPDSVHQSGRTDGGATESPCRSRQPLTQRASRTVKNVPPASVEFTSIEPPCDVMIRSTIYSPSPGRSCAERAKGGSRTRPRHLPQPCACHGRNPWRREHLWYGKHVLPDAGSRAGIVTDPGIVLVQNGCILSAEMSMRQHERSPATEHGRGDQRGTRPRACEHGGALQ